MERKYELWRRLNVESFTRALVVVWAVPLLGTFVKVQLTLLARALRETEAPTPTSAGTGTGTGTGGRELPAEAQQRFIG